MKKNFSRKTLVLNKLTIANLNSVEMRRIQGGSDPLTYPTVGPSHPLPSCDPCPKEGTIDTEPSQP